MTNRELRIGICAAILGISVGVIALSAPQDMRGDITTPSSISLMKFVQGAYRPYYFTGVVNYPEKTGLFCDNTNSLQPNTDCITGPLPESIFGVTNDILPIVPLSDPRINTQAYGWNGIVTTMAGKQYLVFASRLGASYPRFAVSPSEFGEIAAAALTVNPASPASSAASTPEKNLEQRKSACINIMNVAVQLSPHLSTMTDVARDSMITALANSIQRNCSGM